MMMAAKDQGIKGLEEPDHPRRPVAVAMAPKIIHHSLLYSLRPYQPLSRGRLFWTGLKWDPLSRLLQHGLWNTLRRRSQEEALSDHVWRKF